MDVAPPNQHPTTNDDELAKVLAGIGANDSPQPAQPQSAAEAAGLQFEETPSPVAPPSALPGGGGSAGATNVNQPAALPAAPVEPSAAAVASEPTTTPPADTSTAPAAPTFSLPALPGGTGGPLDDLKKTALEELRPLVGKLDLPPEDKFDTLLLIIRSTDDQSLLQPAHEAAQGIADETKRAQALLDVIKEIDYFSQGGQPQQPAA